MIPNPGRSSILGHPGKKYSGSIPWDHRVLTDPALIRAIVEFSAPGFEDYTDEELLTCWNRLSLEMKTELIKEWSKKNADLL